IFVILLVLLARHVPGFGALMTAGRVIRYTTIGGLSVGAPVAGLAALDWPPIAVAAASLAVGVLLYGAALLALKDSMLAALHAYLRRSVQMGSVRSPTG